MNAPATPPTTPPETTVVVATPPPDFINLLATLYIRAASQKQAA